MTPLSLLWDGTALTQVGRYCGYIYLPVLIAYMTHAFDKFATPRGGITQDQQLIHLFNGTVLGWAAVWYLQNVAPMTSQAAWWEHAGQLVLSLLWTDVYFYTTHRILHLPWFFRSIHHVHHRFYSVQPWATLYAHPLENLVVNGGVLLGPLYYWQPCVAWTMLWSLLIFFNTLYAHTFPGDHATHHRYPTTHFGLDMFMDRLCGTTYARPSGCARTCPGCAQRGIVTGSVAPPTHLQ
jgi:sterol desaturase/sphingolipid hydroxylase (fatty acid hydroxylase superfamily)